MPKAKSALYRAIHRLKLYTYQPITTPIHIYRLLPFDRETLRRSKPVVILGMHRSGTSLFTKYMQECGLDIGKNHLQESFDNPAGFWEDLFFLYLDRDLLRCAAASVDGLDASDKLRTCNETSKELVSPTNLARLKVYISKSFKKPVWGWKDPRTCVTFPYFERAFREIGIDDIKLIVVVRSPEEVARSLIRRDTNAFISGNHDQKFAQALECWTVYNQFCLEYSKRHPTYFVDYRSLLTTETADKLLHKCVSFCGLDSDSYRFPDNVFKYGLVHHKAESENLPLATSELYKCLTMKARECLENPSVVKI